jgi:hypothetical protein
MSEEGSYRGGRTAIVEPLNASMITSIMIARQSLLRVCQAICGHITAFQPSLNGRSITHEDEKGYGSRVNVMEEKTLSLPQQAWIPQEEIRRNDIDNEKGKCNGRLVRAGTPYRQRAS